MRDDVHGRMVEKRSGAHTIQTFRYNSEHQLVEVIALKHGQRSSVRFDYDALGRRVAKHSHSQQGQGSTRFLWDGMQMVMETGYAKETLYIYEPESYTPLARIDRPTRSAANDPGSVYWYHATPNGLPEELTDRNGQIIWQARYHSWGNLALETQPAPASPGQDVHDNLRHAGQYHDRETGLFYNTFRYFDPDIGRFTTEDPIGLAGGHNLYQYAPNPFAWIDPWGWLTFPAASPDLFPTKSGQSHTVSITMQGSRGRDFTAAYKAAGISKADAKGYTWHHVDDFDPKTGKTTMQLVKTDGAHKTTSHSGSVAQFEKASKTTYGSKDALRYAHKKGWISGRTPSCVKR